TPRHMLNTRSLITPTVSQHRRRVLQWAGTGLIATLAPSLASAQIWQQVEAIRKQVGNSPVSTGGLELTLPLVAEDGSSVPLAIKSGRAHGSERIERLEIFAPGNPTPEVAKFEFGPEIDHIDLATRIRLSESQTVVAVA